MPRDYVQVDVFLTTSGIKHSMLICYDSAGNFLPISHGLEIPSIMFTAKLFNYYLSVTGFGYQVGSFDFNHNSVTRDMLFSLRT